MSNSWMNGLAEVSTQGQMIPGVGVPSSAQMGSLMGSGSIPGSTLSLMNGSQQGPMSAFGNFWQQNGQGITEGIGAFAGLAQLYSGFKQLGLQEDAFDFQKDAWNKNYNNQVKDYENRLRDRWAARNNSMAARGQQYQSLEGYLGDRQLTGAAPAGG